MKILRRKRRQQKQKGLAVTLVQPAGPTLPVALYPGDTLAFDDSQTLLKVVVGPLPQLRRSREKRGHERCDRQVVAALRQNYEEHA
jgi:hypothetical protein